MTQGPKPGLPVRFGKYLLVELIAHGGMAEIYKAKSYGVGGFEKTIVIKRILPNYSADSEFIKMLVDEAKICACLQHANIVQIFDLGRIEGSYYIAMEYVHGVDVGFLLSRLRRAKRRLPLELVCFILSEALKGLDYAHRANKGDGSALNIIHRDFNPANILLSFEGEVKVADFGIAKAADRHTKTVVGGMKGKMGYLSPEQVMGKPMDRRSDVFTAGITLWELLTCHRLFYGDTELKILLQIRDAIIPDIREFVSDLSEDLGKILYKALKKNRDERFATAWEFKEALDDYLFDHGVKVSSNHIKSYLGNLFSDRIEKEKKASPPELAPAEAEAEVEPSVKPPRYFVRPHESQPVEGPTDLENLWEMISNGKIGHQAEIKREGSDWHPILEVPELAIQLTQLPSPEESNPNAVADYQGLIAEVSFPKLFYRLAIARESGRLLLTRTTTRKEIYVKDGMPDFVKSNVPQERLGEYLIARGVVTSEQRDLAVKAMKGFSGRLGDTLIGMKILHPHELFEQLEQQVREKVLDVFGWTTGAYRFFSGQLYSGEVVPLRIGSYAMIAEGVRKYTPLEMLRNRYRARLDHRLMRVPNPYLSLDKLGLSTREQRVVDCIDRGGSIREVLGTLGADRVPGQEDSICQVLYILEELEMMEFDSGGRSPHPGR